MRFTLDGQLTENVFHNSVLESAPTEAEVQLAAELYRSWWSTTMKNFFSFEIALREVYAFDASSATGYTYTDTPATPIAGGAVGNSSPNNVALVVTKRTALRGRSFRGRTYWAGIPKGDVAGNYVSSSYLTDINNACDALRDLLVVEGLPMAVRSLYANNLPRATGVMALVTSFQASNARVDSQRRRLPGEGA